jgi:hypothetical protein
MDRDLVQWVLSNTHYWIKIFNVPVSFFSNTWSEIVVLVSLWRATREDIKPTEKFAFSYSVSIWLVAGAGLF